MPTYPNPGGEPRGGEEASGGQVGCGQDSAEALVAAGPGGGLQRRAASPEAAGALRVPLNEIHLGVQPERWRHWGSCEASAACIRPSLLDTFESPGLVNYTGGEPLPHG